MWDLPESGIEPESPALPGGFFTTEPPGKPEVVKSLEYWHYLGTNINNLKYADDTTLMAKSEE